MKTKIFFSIFISCLFFFQACHDDLNVQQKSQITSPSMWKTESDAVAAMYGAFNKFRSTFSYGYINWGEYRTGLWGDGLASQAARDDIYLNKIASSNSFTNWTDLYTTINDCNLILKYTPGITFTNDANKNKVIANALYVRAFCYYWIARVWGDAPLLLTGFESDKQEDLFPSREPVENIFNQVASDINEALKTMPATIADRNMASPAAINALKADYYLWMAKVRNGGTTALNSAKEAVTAIKGNSGYALLPNFVNVFSTTLNQEIIFAWSYIKDEYTGGYPADLLVPSQYISTQYIENPIKVGSHQQWCFYTAAYKAFLSSNASDTRTKTSFDTFYDEPKKATFQWVNKFAGTWENGTRIFDADIIVYRYADILLFSAEIENALGNTAQAITELNRVTQRAYKTDNFYPSTLSKQEVDEKIMDERMKEFAAEGKIWWDYIRFGVVFDKVPSLKGRQNDKNVLLWPVNDASINKNPNIKQTDFGK